MLASYTDNSLSDLLAEWLSSNRLQRVVGLAHAHGQLAPLAAAADSSVPDAAGAKGSSSSSAGLGVHHVVGIGGESAAWDMRAAHLPPCKHAECAMHSCPQPELTSLVQSVKDQVSWRR